MVGWRISTENIIKVDMKGLGKVFIKLRYDILMCVIKNYFSYIFQESCGLTWYDETLKRGLLDEAIKPSFTKLCVIPMAIL